MTVTIEAGFAVLNKQAVAGLISELVERTSYAELAKEVGKEQLDRLKTHAERPSALEVWPLLRFVYTHGFFDLLPAHGVPPFSYDLGARFDLEGPPIGYERDPPVLRLRCEPTSIAGYNVDFPLGLPASVLAANSKWIEFYARRGFDILTYKTVRTRFRPVHQWPNWVFIKDPVDMGPPSGKPVVGYPGYWPDNQATSSMANSFGVPSLGPAWWQKDVRRAREYVREGHQVLIVSVMASVDGSEEAIVKDFADAAIMAARAGADIIEANYSCPNVPGDSVGEVYQDAERAGRISKGIKDALNEAFGQTKAPPLFVKISYLPREKLREFVYSNAPHIDGIVAINTISSKVVDTRNRETFPDRPRAGISGWAIKKQAQEVARNLVSFRNEIAQELQRKLTVLGLGGVLTSADYWQYRQIGVDAVETCTGAFLNPNFGIELRVDPNAAREKPSWLAFEGQLFRAFFEELFRHPTKASRLRVDRKTRQLVVHRK